MTHPRRKCIFTSLSEALVVRKQIVELTIQCGPFKEDQAPAQRNESAHFIGFLLLQHRFGRLNGRLNLSRVNYGELVN